MIYKLQIIKLMKYLEQKLKEEFENKRSDILKNPVVKDYIKGIKVRYFKYEYHRYVRKLDKLNIKYMEFMRILN